MLCLTSVAISTAIAIYAASGAAALSYFGDTLQGDALLDLTPGPNPNPNPSLSLTLTQTPTLPLPLRRRAA